MPLAPTAPTATLVVPESLGILAAIAAVAAAIAGLLGKFTLDEFEKQDRERDENLVRPLTEGSQSTTEIAPSSPGQSAGYVGGTDDQVFWYACYQAAIMSGNQFVSWSSPLWSGQGMYEFYVSTITAAAQEVGGYEHWSVDGNASGPPYLQGTNRIYGLKGTRDGQPWTTGLGNHSGIRFLGFFAVNNQLPDQNDTVYIPGTEQDAITTAHDAGKAVMSAPTDLDLALEENKDLLKFLIAQNDKLLKGQDVVIFNQRQQVEIFARLLDDLANDIENAFDFIVERLGAEDTEVLESPEIEELPQTAEPPSLPDLEPVAPLKVEPLLLPDGGQGFLMPPPELDIEFTPQDQREGRWNPGITAIPSGRMLYALGLILQCVCTDLVDCCLEILKELQDVDDQLDDIEEVGLDTQWQINPPLPGSSDLGTGSISSTTGGEWTGLRSLVWVKLTQTVAPFGSVRIQFANNSGPQVQYVGWMSWQIDGHWTPKEVMTWAQATFSAPKGATGFSFTATHGAQFSVDYWYDNRSMP